MQWVFGHEWSLQQPPLWCVRCRVNVSETYWTFGVLFIEEAVETVVTTEREWPTSDGAECLYPRQNTCCYTPFNTSRDERVFLFTALSLTLTLTLNWAPYRYFLLLLVVFNFTQSILCNLNPNSASQIMSSHLKSTCLNYSYLNVNYLKAQV